MPDWMRLRRGNDWGKEYLAPEPLGAGGYADARRAVVFAEGEAIHVRWPNGDETTERVSIRTTTQTVSDHGVTSSPTSEVPGIYVETWGTITWVPLDANLEVRRQASTERGRG